MNSRPKEPKYARNKNVLVIGGSGSGKTRFFVKPNLMQMHSSYCVTDPKGTILVECGKMLQRGGYKIKVLNTINFSKVHAIQPLCVYPERKGRFKSCQYNHCQHQRRGRKKRGRFLGESREIIILRVDRLHLV